MSSVAGFITWIALAGALMSFVAGAVFAARALRAAENVRFRWLVILGWPFALGRLRRVSGEQAASLNKALVAWMACVLIAAAAWSAASNLHRLAR